MTPNFSDSGHLQLYSPDSQMHEQTSYSHQVQDSPILCRVSGVNATLFVSFTGAEPIFNLQKRELVGTRGHVPYHSWNSASPLIAPSNMPNPVLSLHQCPLHA